jgi:hypothetical protein
MSEDLNNWIDKLNQVEVPLDKLNIAIENAIQRGKQEQQSKLIISFLQKAKKVLVSSLIIVMLTGGVILGLSPHARAFAKGITDQIIELVYLNTHYTKDGYVMVGGQKLTKSEYEMLFAKTEKTNDGYTLKKNDRVQVQLQQGRMQEFDTLDKAIATSGISLKAPSYLPGKIKEQHIYAYDQAIGLRYDFNKENESLYFTIEKPKEGFEKLDNRQILNIAGQEVVLGEHPIKYWNEKANEPSVKISYVVNWIDDKKYDYRIAGEGLSADEMIKVTKSIIQ